MLSTHTPSTLVKIKRSHWSVSLQPPGSNGGTADGLGSMGEADFLYCSPSLSLSPWSSTRVSFVTALIIRSVSVCRTGAVRNCSVLLVLELAVCSFFVRRFLSKAHFASPEVWPHYFPFVDGCLLAE